MFWPPPDRDPDAPLPCAPPPAAGRAMPSSPLLPFPPLLPDVTPVVCRYDSFFFPPPRPDPAWRHKAPEPRSLPIRPATPRGHGASPSLLSPILPTTCSSQVSWKTLPKAGSSVTIHFLFCLIFAYFTLPCLCRSRPAPCPARPPFLLLLLSASAGSHVTDDVSLLTDSASGARHHDYLAD